MFGRILSALFSFGGWILAAGTIKAVAFVLIFGVISLFLPFLVSLIPGFNDWQTLFGNLPSGINYFLSLIRADVGIKLFVTSLITGFVIRRLPFVG